jgi:hypothetical protein
MAMFRRSEARIERTVARTRARFTQCGVPRELIAFASEPRAIAGGDIAKFFAIKMAAPDCANGRAPSRDPLALSGLRTVLVAA